ncbi:S-adenosyl-L-methionine-dependent methyltransferase [Apodospora peruviana]|uniref:S-adenosyl-L-methionine-dependent methyltransferase n=1 Tax=Apodospora peruviana TaxID=516989 RepID=A0AAE0I3M9_9PEZI|nr:S-adenosyl-L-methionine-dependent methyltransferase [Apodospora peruviana]
MDPHTHTIGESSSPTDAVKALKAVHDLLNRYFTKSTLPEESKTPELTIIPVASGLEETCSHPNPSPIPTETRSTILSTDDKQESTATDATNGVIVESVNRKTPNPEAAAPEAKLDCAANTNGPLPNTVKQPTNGAERVPEPDQTTNGSATNKTGGATGSFNHERLRVLADEISCNVDAMSTEEAARLKLVTAALELAGAVRPPQDAIMNWFTQMSVVSAVRVFQHWRVFDAIPAEPRQSISYSELATKVGVEESLLLRMSWMLTSGAVLQHVVPDRLAHTPTSLLLREAHPMGSMFKVMYTNIVETSTILPSYFDTYGKREPEGPSHIPTSFLAGKPHLEYFELLNEDPDRIKMFMQAMSVTHRRVPTTGMYDMSWLLQQAAEEPDRPVWVDVGGGNGHTIKVFREAHPKLRTEQCVVQDLPEVIETAKEVARKDEKLKGVQWVPMNFHKEAPVKGALIYYLRHIIRDYSDPVAIKILSNIRQSMISPPPAASQPGSTSTACAQSSPAASRILISEQLNTSPPPLYSAFKDYTMLAIGGKERTLEQFRYVADAAGLEVTTVYRDRGTPHAVIEMQVKVH